MDADALGGVLNLITRHLPQDKNFYNLAQEVNVIATNPLEWFHFLLRSILVMESLGWLLSTSLSVIMNLVLTNIGSWMDDIDLNIIRGCLTMLNWRYLFWEVDVKPPYTNVFDTTEIFSTTCYDRSFSATWII